MTLKIPATSLANALRVASQIVDTRNTLPLLSMVMIDGDTITTSDLDIEYRQKLDDAEGGVQCCVNAKRLADWAKVAKGTVTMTLDKSILTVKAGRSRLALPALPIKDFPLMPTEKLGDPVNIHLEEIVKRTIWAAGNELSRSYLTGVFMNNEGGDIRFVSTDGYRVASVATNANWPGEAPDIIIPAQLAKIIGDAGHGSLEWDSSKVRFTSRDGAVVTGKVIAEKFPDYRRLFDRVGGDVYAIDPSDLANAVKAVKVATDAREKKLRIKKGQSKLFVKIEGDSGFEAEDEIDADCSEGFECCVNADYLAGMLSALDCDSVSIQQEDANSVMYFLPISQPKGIKFEGLLATIRI